jgi:hypothetical protein
MYQNDLIAGDLFASDALLPAEYYNSSTKVSPERQLLLALLIEAARCYQTGLNRIAPAVCSTSTWHAFAGHLTSRRTLPQFGRVFGVQARGHLDERIAHSAVRGGQTLALQGSERHTLRVRRHPQCAWNRRRVSQASPSALARSKAQERRTAINSTLTCRPPMPAGKLKLVR